MTFLDNEINYKEILSSLKKLWFLHGLVKNYFNSLSVFIKKIFRDLFKINIDYDSFNGKI